MEVQNLQVDSVNDFLNSIQAGQQSFSPASQPQDNITNIQNPPEGDVLQESEEQNFLNGVKKEEVPENKVDEKFDDYLNYFKEQEIVGMYEDGTFPQTKEELANAIKQSSLLIAQQKAQEYIQEEMAALPASLQQIIDYGKGGVTTATELKQFINAVSNYEQVSSLDPANEQHQEAIVRMQLINSGLDEVSADEQIEIYKETNRLSSVAEKFAIPLKETYKKEYQQHLIEKQEKENFLTSQIDANSVNIQYYLDQDTSYLPFKHDDNKVKAGVYELGARVSEWDDKGNPVFGWQKKMENLQYSANPEEYKTFVKILTFMNDPSFYEKKLGKVVSNATTEKEYKQVKQVVSNSMNLSSQSEKKVAQRSSGGPLTWN